MSGFIIPKTGSQYATWISLLLLTCFFLATTQTTSFAKSKAAQWLINEQIKAGCGVGGGIINDTGINELDLTGDGELDLIIDHGAIECRDSSLGSRSGFCGFRACSILFYVREGNLLNLKYEVLSIGVTIVNGSLPVMELIGHNFEESTIKWDGKSFK